MASCGGSVRPWGNVRLPAETWGGCNYMTRVKSMNPPLETWLVHVSDGVLLIVCWSMLFGVSISVLICCQHVYTIVITHLLL